MKYAVIVLTLIIAMACTATEENSTEIFNGKDLTNWKVPKNNIWWTVEEGAIQCKSGPKKKGSTLWTKNEYENFVVELDFKMGEGTIDSGVFLRNDDQIQIGISGSLKRDMTCSPYIPSKRGYPKEAEGVAELLKAKDWNSMKIQVIGPKYTVWLNGKQVIEYESETAAKKGPIGLQLHAGKNMEIWFRNIKLAELK